MYYLWVDGKALGPFDAESVRQRAQPATLVSLNDRWVEFQQHPDFLTAKATNNDISNCASPAESVNRPIPLLIVEEDRTFEIDENELTVGRFDCDITFERDDSVSRRHARFFTHNGQLMVEDLGSTNGTTVNEERIETVTPLQVGDIVGFGNQWLKVANTDAVKPTTVLQKYESAEAQRNLARAHSPPKRKMRGDESQQNLEVFPGLDPCAAYLRMRQLLIGEIQELEDEHDQILPPALVSQALRRGFETVVSELSPSLRHLLGEESWLELKASMKEKYEQLDPQISLFVDAYQQRADASSSGGVFDRGLSRVYDGWQAGFGVRGSLAVGAVDLAFGLIETKLGEWKADGKLADAQQSLEETREGVLDDLWDTIIVHLNNVGDVKIPNSRTIGKTLHRVGALFDNCEDHLSNGRYEEAQRAAQAAVNASPGVAYSHFILAEALIASGQGNEALAQLEQVRHLQPDVTLGCMLTARALLSLERFDEALEYAERAAVESPHNADTHDLVFQTHCLSGNAAGARATFDRVMSFFDQGSPEARLCQARLECTCGDLQTARRTISLLLDENPDVATLLVDDVQTDQILAPAIESEEFSSFKGPVGDVRRELEKVLFHNDSNCFFSPRIPEKKMTAAKESYVGLKEGETLLCLFDTTVFHGAKEGIAFTDLGIFFKNYEGKAGFIKYLDLFEPQLIEEKGILGDVGVKIGDTLIAVADDDERRGLARVLAELGRQARSQQSVG